MKKFFTAFYIAFLGFKDYLFREVVMYIPFYVIRAFFIRHTIYKLGNEVFFSMGVEIRKGHNIIVGNNTIVNKKVLLDGRGGKVEIGNNVDIAQEVNIWTLSHDPNSDSHGTVGRPVTIDDYVWIGARATILPGVTIGRGAVIGTGSIVTKNVAPMAIVAGVPARQIGVRQNELTYKLNHQPWFR